jgi:cellulose synthase operon protein C
MSEDQAPEAPPDAPRGARRDDQDDDVDAGLDAAPDGDDGDDEVLRRAARAIHGTTSLQAFAPLTASEREQVAEAAFQRVTDGAAPARVTGDAGSAAGVSPLRPRRRVRSFAIVALAATVAVAATVALVVRGGGPTAEPLARYAMTVEGEQRTRGAAPVTDDQAPVELHPETHLALRLVAARPERDALVRLVLVRDGHATLLDPPITRRKDSLAIEGPAGELLGPQADGVAELVAVLGRSLPGDDDLRALVLHAGDPPRALQVLRRAVRLTGFSHTSIELLLGGCAVIIEQAGAPDDRAPPRCELAADARLQLWVGVPATTAVAIDLAGRALALTGEARGDGTAFTLEPSQLGITSSARLTVRVGDRDVATWSLAPAATYDPIRAADDARRDGRLADARAALDAIGPDAPAEEQLEAVRQRAKLARRLGDPVGERAERERAVTLARALGRISVESDETVAILYGLRNDHAFARAVQLLPALDAHGTRYAEGAVRRDLVHGIFASELGDLGTALGAYQRALATADRIGDARDRAFILGPLAGVLQSLGRDGETRSLIDAEIRRGARDTDVCARIDALTSAAWLLRDLDPPRAQQLADQAVGLATARCERLAPISLVNQGWLHAAAHQFPAARAALDQLARLHAPREDRVTTWAVRLEAETLLGEDPARAEHHARVLAARAAALCSTELAYEADLLRARALVRLDRPAQATAAFAAAEDALTLWSRLVPLGEGRETFFERHDQLALTAIPFFLAQIRRGAPGAKLALAATVRRSLARFVSSLAGSGQARARAEHGATERDQLARQFEQLLARWPEAAGPTASVAGVCEARDEAARASIPALGEPPAHAALFIHPSPTGWLVLAWRGAAIDVRELPRAEPGEHPEQLAARIARTAAGLVAGAPRVHLHVHRSLAALPLDRLVAQLVATQVPVAFAIDASAPPALAACHGERRALLVSNPRNNLWAASAAAPTIRGDLERLGFRVDALDGAAATRAAVLARLAEPCTALFHYDGHAGGLRGRADRADDALLLAGGDTVTAAEILELGHVPDSIVLNGCTTAAPEGLGLAQAFLLTGAAHVVASLDDISADTAAQLSRQLFAPPDPPARDRTPAFDLVALYTRAVSGTDLPALRAFER